MRRLDQLTFTRFVAAFSVLLFHGGNQVFPFYLFPLDPLLTSGKTAVSYFFVLSGFVMALVYHRPDRRFDLRGFWTARFSRIYPVYLLAFVLTCVYYIEIISKVKSPKIWANLLLYQAWIPSYSQSYNMAAWSLSVEAFFYILFPLVALVLRQLPVRRVIALSIGFWVLSTVIHSLLYFRLMPGAELLLDYFPLFHLSAFLLGVAGGVWYLSEASQQQTGPKISLGLLLLGLSLISLAMIGYKVSPRLYSGLTLDVGLLAPFFLVVILALAMDNSRLSGWLSGPAMVLLGDASYALYILHVPVRWLVERSLDLAGIAVAFPMMYAIYMPLMVLLSIGVFVFIERPARDWIREHMDRLPLILLDLGLIAAGIWAGFVLRLRAQVADFPLTETFALRTGLVLYFLALVAARSYRGYGVAWKSLVPAVAAGSLALTVLMYYAWKVGWVEAFPRVALLLGAALSLGLMLGSRYLLRLWRPRGQLAGEGT